MTPLLTSRKTMESDFNLSEAQVFRMTRTPGFPAPYRIGRNIRWKTAEVAEWMEQQRDAPTVTAVPGSRLVADPAGTSANLTGRALDHNIEAGTLIQGGLIPKTLHEHFRELAVLGVVQTVDTKN